LILCSDKEQTQQFMRTWSQSYAQ